MMTEVGTVGYIAPEVFNAKKKGGYTTKVDIWSFGVTALEMVCGYVPSSYMAGPVSPNKIFSFPRGKKLSPELKEVIEKSLVTDPKDRLSALELLELPFFEQAKSSDYLKFPDIIDKLNPSRAPSSPSSPLRRIQNRWRRDSP